MDAAFRRFLSELSTRPDITEVEALLTRTLDGYGFHTFAYLSVTAGDRPDDAVAVSTYPAAWKQQYRHNRYDHVDPVVARSATTMLPFIWSIRDMRAPATKQQRRFFREADEYGIRYGLTVPVHDRCGAAATLTIATADPRPQFRTRIESCHHQLHLMAIHLHAWTRQRLLSSEQAPAPVLTEREIACLQWVARGKSATDIAEILRIRRRTVVFHVENAKRKFGVTTLHQAVAKAVVLNIISV